VKISLSRMACLAAALIAASALLSLACTVKKKRAPGPLVVWLLADPDTDSFFRLLSDEFSKQADIEIELVFKETYEVRALLFNNPESIQGKVDLVEVDLYDLEQAAPAMEFLDPLFSQLERTESFPIGALAAGEFSGRKKFIPWRLSWPMMAVSSSLAPPDTWERLGQTAQANPGEVLIPALDDREFFSFLCSVVWAFGGDPAKPYDDGLFQAFQWLAEIGPALSAKSSVTRSAEIFSIPAAERPGIFFEWPQGLLPFILDASFQINLSAAGYPCGRGGNCPVLALGRYFGIPRNPPHLEDAYQFILFIIGANAQNQILFGTPWLPANSQGLTDLGARKAVYSAFAARLRDIKPPPRPVNKIERALTAAGRMLLFEQATPHDAITKYRKLMEQE